MLFIIIIIIFLDSINYYLKIISETSNCLLQK